MKSPFHLVRLTFYGQWGTLLQTLFRLDSYLVPTQFLASMVRLKFRPLIFRGVKLAFIAQRILQTTTINGNDLYNVLASRGYDIET
jgi:hypothetical protein